MTTPQPAPLSAEELTRAIHLASQGGIAYGWPNEWMTKTLATIADRDAKLAVCLAALLQPAAAGKFVEGADNDVVFTPIINADYSITAGDLRECTKAVATLPASTSALLTELSELRARQLPKGCVAVCENYLSHDCADNDHWGCRDGSLRYACKMPDCPLRETKGEG